MEQISSNEKECYVIIALEIYHIYVYIIDININSIDIL
jgi:hypothetical protein